MPTKFCPKCGKEDTDFYEKLCLNCYKEENKVIEIPEIITITECTECGSWKYHDQWKNPSDYSLRKIVSQEIESNLYQKTISIDSPDRILEAGDKIKVKLKGKMDPEGFIDVEEESKIEIRKEKGLCSVCLRLKNKDYRLKIQLRKNKEEHDPERFKEIKEHIERTTEKEIKRDHKAVASWRTRKRKEGGWNFYYGYTEIGKKVLKEIKEEFGLKTEKSTQDAGLDKNGRRKIREVYCIRA